MRAIRISPSSSLAIATPGIASEAPRSLGSDGRPQVDAHVGVPPEKLAHRSRRGDLPLWSTAQCVHISWISARLCELIIDGPVARHLADVLRGSSTPSPDRAPTSARRGTRPPGLPRNACASATRLAMPCERARAARVMTSPSPTTCERPRGRLARRVRRRAPWSRANVTSCSITGTAPWNDASCGSIETRPRRSLTRRESMPRISIVAAARLQEVRRDAEKRRLPGPVRAEEPEQRALGDRRTRPGRARARDDRTTC